MVDSTDHFTGKTGLTVTVTLSKNGGAFAAAGGTVTEIASGIYKIALTTTDTNTLGDLVFHCTGTGADATDFIDQVSALIEADLATQTSVNTIDDFLDTEIAAILAAVDTEVAAILADTDDIQTRLPAALVGGRIDASVGAMAANVMTAAAAAADLTTELQSGLATAAALDAVDNFVDTEIATIITMLTTIDDFLDTEVAAILADTNELQTDWVDGGRLDLILDARASQASVDTIDDFLDTEIAAIKAKTDLLPDGVTKNTALANFPFMMIDSVDHITPKTGLTVTAERSIDGAAFGACANAVTEVANGWYKITLATTDLNGDTIALKFTAVGADATNIAIKTQT